MPNAYTVSLSPFSFRTKTPIKFNGAFQVYVYSFHNASGKCYYWQIPAELQHVFNPFHRACQYMLTARTSPDSK